MLAGACRGDRWSETEAALICRGRPELPGLLRAKIGDSSLVVTVAPRQLGNQVAQGSEGGGGGPRFEESCRACLLSTKIDSSAVL